MAGLALVLSLLAVVIVCPAAAILFTTPHVPPPTTDQAHRDEADASRPKHH